MKNKIIFYEKQLKANCPYYAIQLLEELQKRNFEILILFGKDKVDKYNTLIKVSYKEIYKNFNIKKINSLLEIENIIHDWNPNLFLSIVALFGFERLVLETFSKNGIKIFEMDTVASEIIYYNYDYRKLFWNAFSIKTKIYNSVVRFLSYFGIDKRIYNRSNGKVFGIQLLLHQYELVADYISLKGNEIQKVVTENNYFKYSKDKFPITGSIHYDYIVNLKPDELYITNRYCVKKNDFVLIMPSPQNATHKPSELFVTKSIEYLEKLNIEFLIQLHPSDRLYHPKRFASKSIVLEDYYSVLKLCKFVIVPRSSGVFEVATAKKMALMIEADKYIKHETSITGKQYSNIITSSIKNLKENILKMYNNKISCQFDEFIIDFCSYNDGKSYLRVADVVERKI